MLSVKIALDAMSGDHGPDVVIPAAINAIKKHSHLHLILVGDQEILKSYLKKYRGTDLNQLAIHHATEIVSMKESPSAALRFKKDSSLRVAINLIKEGAVQACVSAGNTGALMATARFVLKTLPGIDRPAIMGVIPAENALGRVRILDLGANVDSPAETLFQFAVMGSVLTSAVDKISRPKVGLLNIGAEEIKGTEQVKKASRLLSESNILNYIGFVEGNDIFKAKADVIVCDGFVGNVALKTMEGEAKFISKIIKQAFRRNIFTKLIALFASSILSPLKARLNPDLYNGASFLGLKGIVIKSHGGTSVKGFGQAIECALSEVAHNVPELIEHEMSKIVIKEHTSLKQLFLNKISGFYK